MMTIFVSRLWCVKVDPFVGNWSKRRQPKRRQAETLTHRNIDRPKHRQTKASTNQNIDIPKHRQTKTSTDQNVHKPKRRQTETWTVQFSTLYSRVFFHNSWDVLHIYLHIPMIGGMYFIYQYPQLYNYWGLLYISVPARLNLFLVEFRELF